MPDRGRISKRIASTEYESIIASAKRPRTGERTKWNHPLPAETWLEISSYLEPEDKAYLSLTCRFLYSQLNAPALLGNLFKELDKPSKHKEKLKFMFRLYKLFPDRVFCKDCLVYHSPSNSGSEDNVYDWGPPETKEELQISSNTSWTWPQLLERIEDHRVTCDEQCCGILETDKREDEHVAWGVQANLRTHGERVLLYCKYTSFVNMPMLQDVGAISLPTVCEHCEDAPQLRREFNMLINQLPRPWEDFHDGTDLHAGMMAMGTVSDNAGIGNLWRCTWCPSEYVWETKLIESREEGDQHRASHTISLHRAIDLGRFNTPHDRKWVALTTRAKPEVVEVLPFGVDDAPYSRKSSYFRRLWKQPGLEQQDIVLPKELDTMDYTPVLIGLSNSCRKSWRQSNRNRKGRVVDRSAKCCMLLQPLKILPSQQHGSQIRMQLAVIQPRTTVRTPT